MQNYPFEKEVEKNNFSYSVEYMNFLIAKQEVSEKSSWSVFSLDKEGKLKANTGLSCQVNPENNKYEFYFYNRYIGYFDDNTLHLGTERIEVINIIDIVAVDCLQLCIDEMLLKEN